jgi:cysteine desulfuration protein SufE
MNNFLMTLDEIQEEIIQEFEQFGDWMEKYNYLIEISKDLEPIDAKDKVPENVIHGCQSRVWLVSEMHDDKLIFKADSDAIITKGIIALLIRVLSGRKPDEIMNADLYFIDQIGLRQNLSPTRSNGLLSMVKQMKMYGLAYHTKLSKS